MYTKFYTEIKENVTIKQQAKQNYRYNVINNKGS